MIEDKKKDGWYHAGMQIAQLLSMRPEVASEGIVGAVKDILAALDKKPKPRSEKYRDLLSRVLELEKQNEILTSEVNKHRKRRDELTGLALLASEQSDISPKQRLNKIVTEAKRGLSARVLQNSKIAASKLNHE
jgi:hypothetical protein